MRIVFYSALLTIFPSVISTPGGIICVRNTKKSSGAYMVSTLHTYDVTIIWILEKYAWELQTNVKVYTVESSRKHARRHKLIEKCQSPWVSYTKISPSECRSKCEGKAFHTKEKMLICFNEKELSQPKPVLGPRTSARSSVNIKCECGYVIPRIRQKWLPCENNNMLETTIEICEEICKKTTVYLYKRSHAMTILLCENEERTNFYDMVGDNEKVIYYENSAKVKYRKCSCGIASTELKPMNIVQKLSNSAVTFQQCSKPWETLDLLEISKLETCEFHCQRICKRGSGIIHEGEAFCFMRFATSKKRTSLRGAEKGVCECGHLKKYGNDREFKQCNPPITRNGLLDKKCVQLCSKTVVYIHHKRRQQLNIRCIYEPQMKPEPLVGKCDKRIYEKERHSVTRNYTKCSCGIEKFLDAKYEKKRIELEKNNAEITLPESWGVRKKRSIRSHAMYKKKKM